MEIIAAAFGGFFYYMAKQSVLMYTAKSTVFPLNGTSETSPGSTISSLLGLGEGTKSFTGDASINIVELANSRRTREAVAMVRIPSMKNRTVSELLIEENNKHTGFMQNTTIDPPKDSLSQINTASNLLKGAFSAKINKTGILELYFTNSSPELVREVSYIYIDKLSEFYINLKKKKAQIDFEFAVKKANSLSNVLNRLDKQAVALDESTFFTNESRTRYNLPKLNLAQDKATIQSQYYYAVNNRESAAYRLQKETPIIEVLDKPEWPYDTIQKSAFTYVLMGVFLGLIIGVFLVSWKVINKYMADELNKAIEKASRPKEPLMVPQQEPVK